MPVHIVPVHTPVVAVAELALHVSCVVGPNLVYPTVHVTIAVSRYSVLETVPNTPLTDGGDPQSTAEKKRKNIIVTCIYPIIEVQHELLLQISPVFPFVNSTVGLSNIFQLNKICSQSGHHDVFF